MDMLVLHYTGMRSGAEALARLCESAAKVSAHYMVEEDGQVFSLVAEENRAWHAGVSSWRGHTNINQRSIGIEIVNPGHEFGYRPFPEAQMQAVISLCKDILARHPIPARNVVAHSDIAPTRKEDPGELFEWKRLAQAEVGLWPKELRVTGYGLRDEPKSFTNNSQLATRNLSTYGYDTTSLPAAITAFQRHFRPNLLNGLWDQECALLLQSLLDSTL